MPTWHRVAPRLIDLERGETDSQLSRLDTHCLAKKLQNRRVRQVRREGELMIEHAWDVPYTVGDPTIVSTGSLDCSAAQLLYRLRWQYTRQNAETVDL